MSFGLDKCSTTCVVRGKLGDSKDVSLPSGDVICSLSCGGAYRYLGILESNDFHYSSMKSILSSEYKRRLRKVLSSHLAGKYCIQAINTFAVSLLRYSAGLISWTKNELCQLDVKTRKLLSLYHAFSINSDVDRLYVPRNQGGRGLLSIADVITKEMTSLQLYVNSSSEPLLQLVSAQQGWGLNDSSVPVTDPSEVHMELWKGKALHGQFCHQVLPYVDHRWQWSWLKSANLLKETEGFLMAAQEQALTTNIMKSQILHLPVSSLCHLCHSADESIDHLISSCTFLVQSHYKKRHDVVASYIHWKLSNNAGFDVVKNWWQHHPDSVLENDVCRILWDYTIFTGSSLAHNRPDITYMIKGENKTMFIEVAVPGDSRISHKMVEKKERYADLCILINKLWRTSATVVPIVIGALGSIPLGLVSELELLGLHPSTVSILQKAVLLSTARTLRHVLT